jgi:type I restriction enzyme S subunit
MEVREGYKNTEVGIIPEDWDVKELGDFLKVIGGGAFKSRDASQSGVKWLKISNVDINKTNWDDESFLPIELIKDNENFLLKEGDYVLALTRPILDRKLKIARLNLQDVPALLNQRVGKIEVESQTNIDYTYYLFQKFETISGLLQSMAGTDPPNLSNKGIYGIKCGVPPTKAEQTAIATALSDADALINSLEKLIAKKRNIKQGAMQQLLKPKEGWEHKLLGEIGLISGAGVDKLINEDEVPVRLVNYMDVFKRDFIYSNELNHWVTAPQHKAIKCAVKQGDVFFTPSSEMRYDIAVSAVAMEDIPNAVYSYHLVRLRLSEDWDLNFRTYIFKTRYFLGQAEQVCEGSGKRYVITLPKFRSLKVYYPKTKEEQNEIATILSDMDAEIQALETKLEKYRKIKLGMMQNLLTGKIRLI